VRVPTIKGVIERRILVNFRVDPDVISPVLPPPFQPQIVNGYAIGGVCLIRLAHVRPRILPAFIGIGSENAAHRIAVEWDAGDGSPRRGVYIPRRDTSSRLNALAGGRIFPGAHHHARFDVVETNDRYRVEMTSDDRESRLLVDSRRAHSLPGDSVFESLDQASEFFAAGSLGYSATARAGEFEGLELETFNWHVEPLDVTAVESSFFSDSTRFPNGATEFDCALLMQDVEHEWHAREPLCCNDLGMPVQAG